MAKVRKGYSSTTLWAGTFLAGVALLLFGLLSDGPQLWLGALAGAGITAWAAATGLVPGLLLTVAVLLLFLLVPNLAGSRVAPELLPGFGLLLLPGAVIGGLLKMRLTRVQRLERDQARRTQLLTEATTILHQLDSSDAVYRTMLRVLADILEFTHASLFRKKAGKMHPLASHRWEVPADFILQMDSVVGDAQRSAQPQYVPDTSQRPNYFPTPNAVKTGSELAVPIFVGGQVHAVLNLEHAEKDAFGLEERHTLLAFGKLVEEALERIAREEQFMELLNITRSLAQSDEPEQLYEETVRSAIRLIPGAGSGSLLVLNGGTYRFVAAQGFTVHDLKQIDGVTREAELRWYGGSEEEFLAGTPRLITGDRIRTLSLSGLEDDEQRTILERSGRLDELGANICVPIAYRGEVVGVLNIDSFAKTNPFGRHSLLIAEMFAQQIGVIIRQTLYRNALEHSLITDTLTGVGNREGFNRQLNMEIARASRYGSRFNLVMIDLNNFKRVNDTLGHQTGDEVLRAVARAMRSQVREGDSIYRWGGDEFVLILPEVSRLDAKQVAARHVEAVTKVELEGMKMEASFGIASYPEDGTDADTLLRKADELMYENKVELRPTGSQPAG